MTSEIGYFQQNFVDEEPTVADDFDKFAKEKGYDDKQLEDEMPNVPSSPAHDRRKSTSDPNSKTPYEGTSAKDRRIKRLRGMWHG